MIKFTEQQEMLRKTVREFVEKEIAPIASQLDAEDHCPLDLFKKMGELGFAGVFVPQQYGGVGMGFTERAIILEEVGRYAAGLAMALMTHGLGVAALLRFGTEQQKQKYLPDIAAGRKIAGLAVTEPSGGSDLMGHQSTGNLVDDQWILNGRKCFITNSHIADVSIVTVRTGEDAKGRPALTAFLVEKDTPGFSPGHKENKMGLRGSVTGDLNLKDVRVAPDAVLGEVGGGAKVALGTISEVGRPGMAAVALGILRACLEDGVKFAKERIIYGKPLAKIPAIQSIIAQNRVDYEAARLLVYQGVALKDAGQRCDIEIACAKYFTTEASVAAAKRTIDLMGAYGVINEYPVGRYLRDAMTTIPSAGTSHIMQIVIAANTLA